MFKRKKKKTGVQTPELRKPTPPPPPPTMPPIEPVEENFQPRYYRRNLIDTKARFDEFVKWHDDLIKMDGAEVYFSVTEGIVAIVTTQEWKDYFKGYSNVVPNAKENNKCKD